MQEKGLRGIIREIEEYQLNRELILDRLRILEHITDCIFSQGLENHWTISKAMVQVILGSEVGK